MPQIFKIGPYVIYFWSDENMPLEPIHVHVAEGVTKGAISADAILMLKIFDNQNHTRNSMALCSDLMPIYIRNTTKYSQSDS